MRVVWYRPSTSPALRFPGIHEENAPLTPFWTDDYFLYFLFLSRENATRKRNKIKREGGDAEY